MTAVAVEPPLDLRARWRGWRLPLLLAVLVVGTAVVLAVVENAPAARPLDPGDASPAGGRALAQLLRDRGVDVTPVERVASAPPRTGTTVFVPDPASLTRAELRSMAAGPASLVLVGAGRRELHALGLTAQPSGLGADGDPIPAACGFAPATVAGPVRLDGIGYSDPSAVHECYRRDGTPGLVTTTRGGTTVVLLGSVHLLTNDWLGDEGDAALGLGLLSTAPHLLWVVPRPPTQAAADRSRRGVVELLPDRLLWAVLMLFLTVVLAALWRARRIGAVVAEPLPVVVRATETVEGRARLLRAARARGTASASLRSAARERLRDRLGLATGADQGTVVEAVSRRSGWSGPDVTRILYGPDPTDDDALLRLSSEIDQLDRAVRHGG